MVTQFTLGEIVVDVVKKDIKNVHLSVYPPVGKVRISAPFHMNDDTIRVFALSKLGWIKQQQQKLREQERETPREYLERESHYVWGKRYLLKLIEMDAAPNVTLSHHAIELRLRPDTSPEKRQAILETWYRETLKATAGPLLSRWEPRLGVTGAHFCVQRMKTKWGSCSPHTRRIRLNTELAKKPLKCLEYIVVHEMVHLLEPTHNRKFIALMNHFMPQWQSYQEELNRLPVRHETWKY